MGKLVSLTELNISENHLTTVPKNLCRYVFLKYACMCVLCAPCVAYLHDIYICTYTGVLCVYIYITCIYKIDFFCVCCFFCCRCTRLLELRLNMNRITQVRVYVCASTFIYVNMCVYIHTHIRLSINRIAQVRVYVWAYTYIHTYMHIHIPCGF
jgi:hypothetical protein